jgi:uncharacterized membrane protein (Fun14 family)
MKVRNGVIGSYFLILSSLAHAEISSIDKDTILNALTSNIKQQYVEIKKIDEISNALAKFKVSPAFNNSQS